MWDVIQTGVGKMWGEIGIRSEKTGMFQTDKKRQSTDAIHSPFPDAVYARDTIRSYTVL